MRRVVFGVIASFVAGGCSDRSDQSGAYAMNNTMNVDENLTTDMNPPAVTPAAAAAEPAPPSHRYEYREGEFYSYLGAISDEERKRGVAVPSVVRFRYSGFWGGAYHLQTIGDGDQIIGYSECRKPCVVIKQTGPDGSVRRVGYSDSSIIGAAFDDAIGGNLVRAPAVGVVREGYRFLGGDPGNSANWRLIDQLAQTPTPMDADDPAYPAQTEGPDMNASDQ